jgi:Hemerythrin HHE cation binding domain
MGLPVLHWRTYSSAMSDMSMNKAIHGAIRRDLDRFISALDAMRPGDRARAQQLGRAWANFEGQLTNHHEGEHSIAWPALESVGVSRELLSTMDAEHETMAAALAGSHTAMASLERTAGADDIREALTAVEHLTAVTVLHLDHEEAELEAVYAAKHDSPEIKAMGKAFARVSPAKGGEFFAWVLDGASPEEKAAVTRNVPGPVLTIISGVFGRGYRRNVATVWRA